MRALLVLLLLAGNTFAEDSKGPHPEGEYGGVVPGHKPEVTKGQKPKRPPAKGTLSWIGFEVKDGGSQIFLQSVAAFEVSQHIENGALVIYLPGLTRLGQNTWRIVDTRFFATPISKIVAKYVGAAKGRKAGIEVRVTFKNAKDAKEAGVRTATEADGLFYAYLSFGGGAPETETQPTMKEPEK
jgi:hypothetical protein